MIETVKVLQKFGAKNIYAGCTHGVLSGPAIERIKNSEAGMGYDALHDEYVNMLKVGIVDPTKVTRSALQNAASVASTFLTTEAAVVDIPQKEAPMPGAPGMGGMDGMY